MMPSWTVRPYHNGDEAQITQLFAAVFSKALSETRYRWKVLEQPWPIAAPSVWLASAGDQIVGHYAGTATRFQLCGDQILTLHVCDVMTAAAFRRQGVLTALGQTAHQAWAAAGVTLLTGLHYGGWGSRRHYLGWQEQLKLIWVWRPLLPAGLIRRRLHWPSPLPAATALAGRLWQLAWDIPLRRAARNVAVEPLATAERALDQLWAASGPAYPALVVRDRSWLDYRYLQAPEADYRLLLARRAGQPAGYLVYRLTAQQGGHLTGWIADLFSAPHDAAARAALLRAALQAMLAAGVEQVQALIPAAGPLYAAFRQAGFIARRAGFDASIVPLRQDSRLALLRDPQCWYTTGGDFDVI